MKKRVPTYVPQQSIRWIISRLHVSTPDAEIEAEIRKRDLVDPISGKPANEKQLKACVEYAIECHRANQKLYRWVMSGRIN